MQSEVQLIQPMAMSITPTLVKWEEMISYGVEMTSCMVNLSLEAHMTTKSGQETTLVRTET